MLKEIMQIGPKNSKLITRQTAGKPKRAATIVKRALLPRGPTA